MQLREQMQQLQSALYVAGQPPSDFDADKNERHQSTLQFATNLLLQMSSSHQSKGVEVVLFTMGLTWQPHQQVRSQLDQPYPMARKLARFHSRRHVA
ncbi:hypothetical protein HanXRQr2_Chr12g0553581 [Helianthus annuus]|uniref:Uncharacterized protein n=1 Tax=Helianthus annuus TaxID=4232 RepID=A0A9K3HII8_HELAN|nr:hypothetical protein HanXRQr2_Chr12g0553581 [Helianthus annuus]KAJ0490286.1 hypothetical protein HanHA300_Chr12g0453721 [Helianthus annuus]KAJ0494444.1 hypothetical protein HanIR_Chr12g0597551 [Helianthus annuus]KAJ0506204.1 hypothetical protein HanHA89_Chr12g0479301 [Helianthus annuus]KAJ0675875.1 hypothetical protein HanLR1_Chr12g0456211 [Helianthus annuus]